MDGAGGQEDVDPRLLRRGGRPPRPGRCRRRGSGPGRRSPSRGSTGRSAGPPRSRRARRWESRPRSRRRPGSTRAWAISIFSARFMLAPGDCSPSRSVVSKMVMCRCASRGVVPGSEMCCGVDGGVWFMFGITLSGLVVCESETTGLHGRPLVGPRKTNHALDGAIRLAPALFGGPAIVGSTRILSNPTKKPQSLVGLGVRSFLTSGCPRRTLGPRAGKPAITTATGSQARSSGTSINVFGTAAEISLT